LIYNFILNNFKAIGRMQKIPIKPITLVFGPNSSGKSSIIHSLLLMNEILKTGKFDVSKTQIGGDSVDIGGFRQYVFGRNSSLKVKWGIDIPIKDLNQRLKDIFSSVKKISYEVSFGYINTNYTSKEEPVAIGFVIKVDEEEIIKINRNDKGFLTLIGLETNNPIIKKMILTIVEDFSTTTHPSNNDFRYITNSIKKITDEVVVDEGTLFPKGLKLDKLKDDDYLIAPISKANRLEDILNIVKLVLPWNIHEILSQLYDFINEKITKIQYLGPLRSYPPRHFTLVKQGNSSWDASGGYAWQVLMSDTNVRNSVNNWLGAKERLQTPYELVVRNLFEGEVIKEHLFNKMNEYRDKTPDKIVTLLCEEIKNLSIDTDNLAIESMRELILLDKRTKTPVSHRDVGIGISQTLPVLVSAYASKNKIIAIEQPELHLHPGLQSELADVFIKSALGGNTNTFILETHSEHLILRIMRRIRESFHFNLPDGIPSISPDDVSILYVEPLGAEGSAIRYLELDAEGELLDPWPGGFFEEGFNERFS
jgi:predicted ATPase